MRKRVIYTGRVQGVGFRATTHSIASGFDVAGYVRNLPDGTVELLADGSYDELQSFLEEVRTRFDACIELAAFEYLPRDEELRGFRIRY